MRSFVRIENRQTYTNLNRANDYIRRGLARVVESSSNGTPQIIHMLDTSELSRLRSEMKQTRANYDSVDGGFNWFVAYSGGSSMMRQYQGVSGGFRVYQATHKDYE